MNHEATPSVPDDESVDGEFWDKTAKTPSEQNLKGDQSGIGHFDTRAQESHDEWPEIIDIDETPLPSLDWDLLPDWYGDMVRAVAEATETPMEMPALTVLGALATANQKKYEILVEGNYSQPLNLYTMLVSDPGTRKSSAFHAIFGPVFDYQRELLDQWQQSHDAAKLAHAKWKREEKALSRGEKSADGAKSPDEALDEHQRREPKLPVRPQLVTNDATPESLIGLLAQNHERLTFASAEPDVFEMILGRYSNKPNVGIYVGGYDAEPVCENRKHGDPVYLHSPLLTLSVMAQTFAIQQAVENKLLTGRGLLARFLYLMPPSVVGNRTCQRIAIPSTISAAYVRNLCKMLSAEVPRTPNRLKLSAATLTRWKEHELAVERSMRPDELLHDFADWGGKFPAKIVRVAANLHVASCVGKGVDPIACEVPLETLEIAIRFCDVVMHHALAVFNSANVVPERRVARRLLAKIRRESKRELTLRDLKRHLRNDADLRHFDKAVSLLVDSGYLRQEPRQLKPGRPSEVYAVNPATFAQRRAKPDCFDA